MLHEIAPYIFDNGYSPQTPTADSYGLYYAKKTVLVKTNPDGTIDFPKFREIEVENADARKACTYLFSTSNIAFYLVDGIATPNGFDWATITKTMKSKPRHLAFAAVTGYQLFNWYESRKHCGKCGALMSKAEKTRSLFCPSCGQVEYPKIAPAVIVAVTNGNRLLLAEYPNYDKYALLAGFVEIGETLEDTVRREVMEEVGLKVKNIRYYKSQPSSLTDNLMVGFYCELDGSDTINFDADELSNAEWVERENIPTNKDYADGSLTYEMMEHFKNGVAI